MKMRITQTAILLLALTASASALDRNILLFPRPDTHSSYRLYIFAGSVGSWSSPDAKDNNGIDVAISPLLFQFLSGWSEGRAGLSTSLGFAYHNPDRYGTQLELGVHVAQSLTLCGTLLRVADNGWERGIRLAYNFAWAGPAKSVPLPPSKDSPSPKE